MTMNTSVGMNNNNNNNILWGWVCPRCEAVMAPWQNCCMYCIGKISCIEKIPCSCTSKEYSLGKITTYNSSNTSASINNQFNTDKDSLKHILKSNLQKLDT